MAAVESFRQKMCIRPLFSCITTSSCMYHHHHHSDLSFLFPVNGTLLATVDPTLDTPPATADTPPFTRPTPTEGTAVTADLVISRLLPPSHVTPPTVAPTTPFVALKRPPVTRQIMPGGATECSLPPSDGH